MKRFSTITISLTATLAVLSIFCMKYRWFQFLAVATYSSLGTYALIENHRLDKRLEDADEKLKTFAVLKQSKEELEKLYEEKGTLLEKMIEQLTALEKEKVQTTEELLLLRKQLLQDASQLLSFQEQLEQIQQNILSSASDQAKVTAFIMQLQPESEVRVVQNVLTRAKQISLMQQFPGEPANEQS